MLVQVVIDDSTSKVITGTYEFDRANGGILKVPSGTSFPSTPEPGELFVRTDELKIYRRSDDNLSWQALGSIGIAQGSTPPSNPSNGDPWLATLADLKALMFFDSVRNAWLTSDFLFAVFGHDNAYSNYLRPAGIRTPSINTSVLVPRNLTLTRLTVVAVAGAANKRFEIRKNGISIHQFTLNGLSLVENDLNLELVQGDKINVHALASSGTEYDIVINLFGAWRY